MKFGVSRWGDSELKTQDIVSGLLLAILSIVLILVVIPRQTSDGTGFAVSPDLLPIVCAGGIFILSILLVLQRVLGRAPSEAPTMRAPQWFSLSIITLILGFSYIFFWWGGFILGGMALVLMVLLYLGERRLPVITAVTVGAPTLLYGFFWSLLSIPLP
jgi:hypothetical protein